MIRVQGHKNLVRDVNNRAILNYDKKEFLEHIASHKRALDEKLRMQELEQTVSEQGRKLDELIDLIKGLKNGNS